MVWEQRWHPLREEWVIVAAHRQERPWSGEVVADAAAALPRHAADCYLCPGNPRVSGEINPTYAGVFVFDNDHPCVGARAPRELREPPGIYRVSPATGVARVVCYTPRHDLSLAELDVDGVVALFRSWQAQYRELGALPGIEQVLVFENKGDIVGVSSPHPHCQIYATNFVFKTIEIELAASVAHRAATGRVLFQDIVEAEQQDGRRILFESEHAIAFLPYFARFAYETYVAPKRTVPSIAELTDAELRGLASALLAVLIRYDNLWRMAFPYVLVLHQAPTDGKPHPAFHFHIAIQPPLRRPHLRKFLAGPEVGAGGFLADTSPEDKAAELLAVPGDHYKAAP